MNCGLWEEVLFGVVVCSIIAKTAFLFVAIDVLLVALKVEKRIE
jgi:uncharacterized protein (DUF2062 family)